MENKYGILVNEDAKLFRNSFNEMVKLLGIQTMYSSPIKGDYTLHGEHRAPLYTEPIKVGCIFQDHPDQKTAKKLGWDAELLEEASVIHVPYDLPGLQIGCLFDIPSAFDNTPDRRFKVVKMSAKMIYPASISCEIVPEYEDNCALAETEIFSSSDFNMLYEGD